MLLLIANTAQGDPEKPPVSSCIESPASAADWGEDQILASRMMNTNYVAGDTRDWDRDPMNIALVVETSGHHISLLDGDTFTVFGRFSIAENMRGDPMFSADGRYVFILSCGGWVQKYDIWTLQMVGRIHAGLATRSIALSADAKWLAIANTRPTALTILATTDLSFAAIINVTGSGRTPSRLASVYDNPLRESFILALMDAPKIWEVFYGPNPPQMGFAHDWRTEGPVAQINPFPIRKITTADYLNDFIFDPSHEYIIAAARMGGGIVIDLVIGQKVANLDFPGKPHFGGGISWKRGDRDVMAIPHLETATVSVIDTKTWKVVGKIPTQGADQVLYSHENSDYLWVISAPGQTANTLQIIDKQTLETVKTLNPAPGKSVVDVAFTKEGRFAQVLIRDDDDDDDDGDGALIIYDAITLGQVTRLPMRNPFKIFDVSNR